MPSQLPEHAVASLLKQCFVIPRCQAPRLCRQTFSSSFTRPQQGTWAGPGTPRAEALCLERQQRCYYTQDRAADKNEYHRQTSSSGLSVALRQDFQSPIVAKQQSRSYSQGRQPQGTRRIAVLGGGITGLTSAHYLARELPNAQITIYESGNKLGGWLRSKYVDIGNGRILFEQGPRTLRPTTASAIVTLEMVCKIHWFFQSFFQLVLIPPRSRILASKTNSSSRRKHPTQRQIASYTTQII